MKAVPVIGIQGIAQGRACHGVQGLAQAVWRGHREPVAVAGNGSRALRGFRGIREPL